MDIRIGTAGYSYNDWKGEFYPRGIRQGDMLAFYAHRFPVVEVNSSYYGIPKRENVQRMTEQVPDGFEFIFKAHEEMTHKREGRREVFDEFRKALEPACKHKMLGCVLAQFPWSFRRMPENEEYLRQFRKWLPHLPVVIELRNSEWADEGALDLLRDLGFGFCCVDQPRFSRLMPPITPVTSELGYIRFHGRNAKQWEHAPTRDDRYNYLYSQEELEEWVPKVEKVATESGKTYVIYNNHKDGKSTLNAQQMAQLLQIPLPLQELEREEALAAA